MIVVVVVVSVRIERQ